MVSIAEQQPLVDQKIPHWKRLLNVEPAMLFYSMAFTMSQVNLQNLLLRTNCKEWDPVDRTCRSELDAQVQSSQVNSVASIVGIVISIVTTMIAGTMVDRNLKYLRWFILLPLFGQLIGDIVNSSNMWLFHFNGITIALYTALIPGLFGVPVTFPVMCSSYVAHTSTKKERTIKMSYLMFTFTLGAATATIFSGYLIEYCGIFYSYLICVVLEICAFIAVLVFVESRNFQYSEGKRSNLLTSLLKDDVYILKKERPRNKRTIIIFLFIIYGIIHAYPIAETTVLYLFMRNQFDWDAFTYGIYIFLKQLMKCLGAVITAEILKRRLKLQDVTIGLICAILEMSMGLSWLLVNKEWQIYVALLLGPSEKVVYSLTFSLASKCVEPYEFGRLSSIYGTSTVLVPIGILLYNGVYELTIVSFPRAIFLISTSCSFIIFVLFSYLGYLTSKQPLYYNDKSSS